MEMWMRCLNGYVDEALPINLIYLGYGKSAIGCSYIPIVAPVCVIRHEDIQEWDACTALTCAS